ncbi:Ku protein [Citricoccus nitrophenolicus]|uniref:Non-homologous end joining protein Ku n=1 Tax=Citricoccus nitrophenolicus TaxID=863575 RepID=A0ABV0IIN9_9MICC
MRAIWSGSITFGLVNVPVKAYSAAKKHDISFHQVHDADGGRIRYQRRCEVCGKKIDYEHIDKAYEDGEQTVVLTDEDFDALPEAQNDEIEVAQFVPSEQIDPVMFGKSYFLEPQGKSPKSYLLLRQALQDTDRTAVVTFALRQKTRLGALRVQDDVLVLQSMYWADEIREVDFPATQSRAGIGAKEKKLAAALVDQFASDFTPEEFEDTYQVELRRLIDAKFEQGDALDTEATFGVVEGEDEGGDAEVIDLMQALKASLDRKRGSRGTQKAGSTTSSARTSSAEKSGSKKAGDTKSAAEKSSAKKTGAKKTGAKKTGAKKTASKDSGPKTSSSQKDGSKKSGAKKSTRSSAPERKSA